jgi:hypothetical protein
LIKSLFLCPKWKWAVAWDLREMVTPWEERVEGGPGPPKRGKDKQSMHSTGRDMEKDEEEQSNRMLWKRIGTNRVSSYLIKLNFYRRDCRHPNSNCCFFFLSGE